MGNAFNKAINYCHGPSWMCNGSLVNEMTQSDYIQQMQDGNTDALAREDSAFSNAMNSLLPSASIHYNKMGLPDDTLDQQSTRDTSLLDDRVGRLGGAHF